MKYSLSSQSPLSGARAEGPPGITVPPYLSDIRGCSGGLK